MSRWMEIGPFQTRTPAMIEVLSQARNLAFERYPILILGAEGTGRRTLANLIREWSGSPDPLLRFSEGISLSQVRSGSVILFENLDLLSFQDQDRALELVEHVHQSERPVFWMATASEQVAKKVRTGSLQSALYDFFRLQTLRLPSLIERQADLPDIIEENLKVYQAVLGQDMHWERSEIEKLVSSKRWSSFADLESDVAAAVASTAAGQVPFASQLDFIETENHPLTNGIPHALSRERSIGQTIEGRLDRVAANDTTPSVEATSPESESPHQAGLLKVKTLAEMERDVILQTVRITRNNRTEAARLLGISSRTLRTKLAQYRRTPDGSTL